MGFPKLSFISNDHDCDNYANDNSRMNSNCDADSQNLDGPAHGVWQGADGAAVSLQGSRLASSSLCAVNPVL